MMRGPMGKPPLTGGPGEKPSSFRETWDKLFSHMGKSRLYFFIAVILAAVGTALMLIGPGKISDMTDLIEEGIWSSIDLGAITSIGVFLVILYLLSMILTSGQNHIMATISQRMSEQLRTDASQKINRLPLRYFDRSSTGDILSRVTNDIDTVGQSMNQSIGMLVTSVTLLIGSAVMMIITNVTMAAAAILSALAGFAMMALMAKFSQKYFIRQQIGLGEMNGHVEEIYSNHSIVKVYNGEEEAERRFDSINDDLLGSAFKSQFISGMMMPLMMFIGNFGYVVVCIIGAVLVLDGTISIGIIVAFMLYIRMFTQPLSQISQAVVSLQSMMAASERVFNFLEEPELENEKDKTIKLTDVKGDVRFSDVHFGYDPGKEIIKGFSINVEHGQKVAIVGPTGAGKTTIVNLLMRFYEVNSGDISIDGVSIKDLKRENVHDIFCMVLQDTWIFEGTIRDNILYCNDNVTDEEMIAASKAVGLHHYVMTLPEGYDTVLSDKTAMSTGQRQQITIARAMVDDSPLLILDEATSSVDTRTEKDIQNAMDALTKGRTSFVIAHRLSTIRNADIIIVMKDGSIVEHGSHDELMQKGGVYGELYNSQFQEAEI